MFAHVPGDVQMLTAIAAATLAGVPGVPEYQQNIQHVVYVLDQFRFSGGMFFAGPNGILWAQPAMAGVICHALLTGGTLRNNLEFAAWGIEQIKDHGAQRLCLFLPRTHKRAMLFARLTGFSLYAIDTDNDLAEYEQCLTA